MKESSRSSKVRVVVGVSMLAVGIIVFGVRLLHDGAYAVPRGGNLFGGLGALLLGGLLMWSAIPRVLAWLVLALCPVVLFFGLYATMSELEEVISLYATDRAGGPAELRLWIVDRDDGEWVGMQRSKAVDHALDGARLDMLRAGITRCVVPVLHEDRSIVRAIHAQKVDKYRVAQISAAIGLYPAEARETTVALRLDPCP
jgi:hypothetical protein